MASIHCAALILFQPSRDVAPAVKNAPEIDTVHAFAIEDQIRKALQWPATQSGNVEFVDVARRTCGWMLLNVSAGLLKRIDKAQRECRGFVDVMVDGLGDILVRKPPPPQGFHDGTVRQAALEPLRMPARNAAKYPASASPDTGARAP